MGAGRARAPPKDYVRLRLTGEHAIDAAEASGTLLFDVAAAALERRGLRRARDPDGVAAAARTSRPEIGGAGDQQAGALGVGVVGPGPLSVVLGTSGVVFAALPEYARRPARRASTSSATPFPDTWEAMGVMLSAAGSLRWLRDVVGGGLRRADRRGRALAGRDGGAHASCPTSRASGRRMPTRTRAGRVRRASSLRHDRGALVRAVLEGVAYGLRDSLELLRELGVDADGRARVSGGGARSELWLKIVASVLGIPLERTAVEEGAAYGAALLGGRRSRRLRRRRTKPSTRASASATRSSPTPTGSSVYDDGYARFRALYPALRRLEEHMSLEGKVAVHHRREPRHRRRGRALAVDGAACQVGLASRSGDDLGLERRRRARLRRPRLRRGRRVGRRDGRALRPARHPRRERRRRRLRAVPRALAASTSRR